MSSQVDDSSSAEKALKFYVIGDYGDSSKTSGLKDMARTMAASNSRGDHDFILTAGDNVYSYGVEDIKDLSKVKKILTHFNQSGLKDVPIYATLGNHDCRSNYKNEITMSKYFKNWNMEHDYYEVLVPLKDDPTKFIGILQLNPCKLNCKTNIHTSSQKARCEEMHMPIGDKAVLEHYAWIEKKLDGYKKNSNVVWSAVTFHHPLFWTDDLKVDLLPVLEKYEVDFMFVGHKHWLEYLRHKRGSKLKYPKAARGKTILNCDAKTYHEYMPITKDRAVTFKQGDLHSF